MKISALLTTYNRGQLLERVLHKVALQTLKQSDYELIIVDDGSTDSTPDVVKEFQYRLPIQYFRQDNAGLAAARNHGLARARAPIILMMDDDDIIEPYTFFEHLKSHEQYSAPEFAVLGFTSLEKTIKDIPLMSFITETSGHLFSYRNLDQHQFLDFRWFWGGRTSFKRDYVLQSGGFNPIFRFGCEDIELAYRLSKRGLKVVYNPVAASVMIRRIRFEDFCNRLYLQGRSQRLFSYLYEDTVVQEYCEIQQFQRDWFDLQGIWRSLVERAGRLNRCVEQIVKTGLTPVPEVMRELHQSYYDAFRAVKYAGLAGEKLYSNIYQGNKDRGITAETQSGICPAME